MMRLSTLLMISLVSARAATAFAQDTEAVTRVYLNGVPSPVYFNDGDTFRVLGGKHRGMKGRLGGYNTLETFGPVHRWGDWDPKELYAISKMATMSARRGVWHCESKEFEADTYGRVLWHCKDLGLDHMRRGYAHVLSIDYSPGDPELLAAQREAMENKRGMWAHGIPNYLITSIHSTEEGGGTDGRTYNRLVSTHDGHSAKWEHNNKYGECEWVCRQENNVPYAQVKEAVEELIVDPEIGQEALQLGEPKLEQVVGDFAYLGYFGGIEGPFADKLKGKLEAMVAAKKLGDGTSGVGSCSLYVLFERRYGATRPECLK